MSDYYVYGHINPITKKFFYIGKGRNKRLRDSTNRSDFWKRVVRKYGFVAIKLVDGLTEEQAFEIERQYIKRYGLRIEGGLLVNLSYGGEGNEWTDSRRKEASNKRIGTKMSESSKLKCSISKIGELNPNYGKKTWLFGKKMPPGMLQKMIVSKTGVRQSSDNRQKSLAALKLAREAKREQCLQVRCLSTGIIWKNKWECIESLGIKDTKFKDMVRSDGRRIKKLEYIKK